MGKQGHYLCPNIDKVKPELVDLSHMWFNVEFLDISVYDGLEYAIKKIWIGRTLRIICL